MNERELLARLIQGPASGAALALGLSIDQIQKGLRSFPGLAVRASLRDKSPLPLVESWLETAADRAAE